MYVCMTVRLMRVSEKGLSALLLSWSVAVSCALFAEITCVTIVTAAYEDNE